MSSRVMNINLDVAQAKAAKQMLLLSQQQGIRTGGARGAPRALVITSVMGAAAPVNLGQRLHEPVNF